MIDHDLDNNPLWIKTDSEPRSFEIVTVQFYNSDGDSAGGIEIWFLDDTPRFSLNRCITYQLFPTTPDPTTRDKVWKISLDKTEEITRVIVHLNGVEVMKVPVSEDVCNQWQYNWSDYWTRRVESIRLIGNSTSAPDYYLLENHNHGKL